MRDVLDAVRRGTRAGVARSGATFADAAAEWLRLVEEDRESKPSTVRDYRSFVESRLLPAFGAMRVDGITSSDVEKWRVSLTGLPGLRTEYALGAGHWAGLTATASVIPPT